jgi:uncharacterized membrane protein
MIIIKFIKRILLKNDVTFHEWLILSCCFSCLLFFVRVVATGSLSYLFLPWNLFLAFIPYLITCWLVQNISVMENKGKVVGVFAIWLLFFPNSFYIITDLFHLGRFPSAPQWFDLLMTYSFAWNGVLIGIIALRRMEAILEAVWGKSLSVILVLVIMTLCAFGIYIGRFMRYNSWDLVTNPFSLAEDLQELLLHPFDNSFVWAMTTGYAVFLTLLYFTLKKLAETIK